MPHRLSLPAVAVLVLRSPGAAALGQPIYRCGDSYSQTPCPGAVSLQVDDSRSAAQKAHADAATIATHRAATTLERERLAQERASEVNKKRKSPEGGGTDAADTPARKAAKKTKPVPPYFTAGVPAEKSRDKVKKPSAKPVKATVP